ncbi:MAG: DsrE/DsrF/DrsH-like family protein [Alphaproteobacteria bacterium]|nr:DsrE/DsrF/DrsH-like family protein [Alphaproteobacteria bacterium]
MSNAPDVITVDCRGMRCPAPILAVARAAKAVGPAPAFLQVMADDGDFPTDLRAWCRSTGAELGDIVQDGTTFTADVRLNDARPAPAPVTDDVGEPEPEPAEQTVSMAVPSMNVPAVDDAAVEVDVDCRGMACPAPILAVSKAYRSLSGTAGTLVVRADDGDFPTDLRAWCRSTGASLRGIEEVDGAFVATIDAHGKAPTAQPTPAAPATADNRQAESAGSATLDLGGVPAQRVVLQLGNAFLAADGNVTFTCDASARATIQSWAPMVGGALVDVRVEGATMRATLCPMDADALEAPSPPTAIAPAPAPAPVAQPDPDTVPRRNATTLLILRNDFESLMAAMMVANASAAQGMHVDVYFSFWGVNLLRADQPHEVDPGTELATRPTFLHTVMKWMMPKGPDRQKMSKMHMGGMGLGMMKYFMTQQNVLSLRQLMDQAVELGVVFKVCTMSMGIMGIEKRDLMDLPNLEFGGVTAFTADARTSASSMVF